ncbi:MAG: type II toxin-antitoxin system RelE/ParE family toxin [Bacteroidota bacterium]|nr:type II toxin-antitoxin system RelE/ParE family toxin [Bacteroidota bacterium]
MTDHEKPLIWLHGEIKTPPLSSFARIEVGFLLRRIQQEEKLSLPQSRPMPSIGKRCHELRINDANKTWRIIYSIYEDSILILDVFEKKTQQTPKVVIKNCKKRISLLEL